MGVPSTESSSDESFAIDELVSFSSSLKTNTIAITEKASGKTTDAL